MSLETLTPETLKGRAINELQGLSKVLLAGTTANTNIPVAGLKLNDTIHSILAHDPNAGGAGVGGFVDVTSEGVILTAGNLQLDTTNTTGFQLILEFYAKPVLGSPSV